MDDHESHESESSLKRRMGQLEEQLSPDALTELFIEDTLIKEGWHDELKAFKLSKNKLSGIPCAV